MDKDYRLGRDFSECIQKLRPDTQQKLLAILSDYAGSDHEIIAAFRLLFGDPLYVSLFLELRPVNLAQVTSLASIACNNLSPSLAKRAESFVRGYFGVSIHRSSSTVSSNPTPSSPWEPADSSVDWKEAGSEYVSTASEESTIFADEEPGRQDPKIYSPQAGRVGAASDSAKNANLKLLVLAVLAGLLGVAIFKVPAVCEPFGLCEKKKNSGTQDSKGLRSGDSETKSGSSDQPTPDAPQPQPEALSPQPGAPQPRSEQLSPAPVPNAPAPAPPIAAPQPAYTPPPRAEGAPLRDEPLW